MRDIIQELWNGNLSPCEQCGENVPEITELSVLMERNKTDLCSTLSQHEKLSLEKFESAWEEYSMRMTEIAFHDGFCLASKLLTESLMKK